MKNRWNDRAARSFIEKYKSVGDDIALRTYSARLIGQDPNLVLHGGGNTSVKMRVTGLDGEPVSVLCVKGSGWDLDTIEPAGHPAVRMDALLALRKLPKLSDEDMVNALRSNMLDSSGPNPSVETLLHAFLPHKYIDHTHADAVLSIIDQPDGIEKAQQWTKRRMGIVPYIMPGFALAKLAAEVYETNPSVEGLILYKHGIFTFGRSAKESYDRMIYWVSSAEAFIRKARFFSFTANRRAGANRVGLGEAANVLRGLIRDSQPNDTGTRVGSPIVRFRSTPSIRRFVNSRQADVLSQIGPATPDHVIRTKAKPLYLSAPATNDLKTFRESARRGIEKFKRDYNSYIVRQMRLKKVNRIPLDPLPRIAIVPGMGLFSMASDARAADIALDIYEHTISIIQNACRVGRYEALDDNDLFDMEYWSLEQAKLGKSTPKAFSGKIVWISGAASGIGLATALAFHRLGAHVFATDMDRKRLNKATAATGLKKQLFCDECDVTKIEDVEKSFRRCSEVYGGVDIVVSNAGAATTSLMKDCDTSLLRKSFEINFFSHQNVAKTATGVFERQGFGDALLFNASKSSFNPGPEFGPYTLPKTALIGLMKQYAIELGRLGVRCNAVNADRVRTRLFKEGLLQKRARARGLSVKEYLSGNLLGSEVYAEDVADAFVFLALARKTTGATLPVDGGNIGAFPR